jgi:phosphate transport system permease protein
MSPALRTKVKPAIELMQALPTVILGFLAGLWLAPTIEANLPGIVSLLIVTPIIIFICGFVWMQIPLEKRSRIPDGWAPVILILPILLGGWISFASSQTIELAFLVVIFVNG